MIPSKQIAIEMMKEAEKNNPGPWTTHSLYTAKAAYLIASEIPELDANKAYILGYLHDIGRREGVRDLHHVIHGYIYLKEQGFEEAGRICLTHSFVNHTIEDFNGELDCTKEEIKFIKDYIKNTRYTLYDKLIQLCDYLALPDGFCILEKRMIDVALRRGVNDLTVEKWKKVFIIKDMFEEKLGKKLYDILTIN